jgi:hypothetical protein
MLVQDYIETDDEIVDSGVELTPEVVSFTYLNGFRLLISFENGEKRVFDVGPYLNESPMTQPLRSVDYFRQAFCSGGTIEWPDGLNFCQDTFYGLGVPVSD